MKNNKLNIENGIIWIKNEKGEEVKCDVILIYESDETHMDYIVYTDNTLDDKGNTKLYASIYKTNGDDIEMEPIDSPRDWRIITGILDELKNADSEDDSISIDIDDDLPSLTYDELHNLLVTEKHIDFDYDILQNIICILAKEKDDEHIEFLFDSLISNNIKESLWYFNIGKDAYGNDNYKVAAKAFRKAVLYSTNGIFYEGYIMHMIRRREMEDDDIRSEKDIVNMFRAFARKKEPISLINLALLLIDSIRDDDSWELGNQLVSHIDKSKVHRAYLWWLDLGKKDDIEGLLVHLLLIRNGKINNSQLGSMDYLFDRVKSKYPTIPSGFRNIVTPYDTGDTDEWPDIEDIDMLANDDLTEWQS